ncbi:MAG: tRNA uridine-5-carboxymethylaminomethyl(34) synthesis GTPase MnmE [Candidatus Glassbacteria bacterium]
MDTIAAVSTPAGIGAVAIVRISGPDSWAIVRRMVTAAGRFDKLEPRRNSLFAIVHPLTGDQIDRALVVKYREPESFTGEDVVELQCHGGLAVPAAVCEAAAAAGARTARAGEFTRRAFLNGRLDLAQAEAVDGLVHARSDSGRRIALSALRGDLGEAVTRLRVTLLELKAEIEYSIDFPDEEEAEGRGERTGSRIEEAAGLVRKLLEGAEQSLILGRGLLTVIAGAPNVGKSSIFNRLLGRQRSIVAATAGTTRDAVETETMLDGVLVRLVDTAGLRKKAGRVEKMGVEYSRRFIDQADLVVFVHEAGADFAKAEREFLDRFSHKQVIRAVNKVDLLGTEDKLPEGYLALSARTGLGFGKLREKIVRTVLAGGEDADRPAPGPRLTSLRQKGLLEEALACLERAGRESLPEFISAEVGSACDRLGEITGAITSSDVLDSIFSRFCIGK